MKKKAEEIFKRIKTLIKNVAEIVDGFPRSPTGFKIGDQIIASVTSIGANFVEAQSARSKKEFVSIMGIVLKETKETIYWLELCGELNLTSKEKINKLIKESSELAKIFASIILTSSKNLK